MNKKSFQTADSGLTVLLTVGILIAANILFYSLFVRWDLTSEKVFSLSPASKAMASGLEDIVNVKIYASNNLPSQFLTVRQELDDLLEEYRTYSGGKIRIETIDPTTSDELARNAAIAGIPEVQFNVYDKDRLEVAKGYFGIAITQGNRIESIPFLQDTNNLEYKLSVAIKKASLKEKPVVGYITGFGTLSAENDIKISYDQLAALYDVRQVELAAAESISDEIDTLILAGPKETLSEAELKKLDAFLMKGGSLILLVDGVKLEDNLMASDNEIGINGLLNKYGLGVTSGLILDESSGMANFSRGIFTYQVPYLWWPKVVGAGFNRDYPAVSGLEAVVFPWASAVTIDSGRIGDAKADIIAATTDTAWEVTQSYNLNPDIRPTPAANRQSYPLAVSLSGPLKSAYGTDSTDQARLVVVGDSEFVLDRIAGGTEDNSIFFQNLVDSLTLDDTLISIRSKGVTSRPIKELSDAARSAIRYANVLSLTVLVIAFGLIRYWLRKRSRFVDDI